MAQRNTFLSFGDILKQAAGRLLEVEVHLRDFQLARDEQWHTLAVTIAEEELDLAADMASYAEKGPKQITGTLLQYRIDDKPFAAPVTLAEALDQLMQVNREIELLFGNLAEKTSMGELHEELSALRDKLSATSRRISNIRITSHDM